MRVLIITPMSGGFAGHEIGILRDAPSLQVEVMVVRSTWGPKLLVLAMAIWQALTYSGDRPDIIHAYSSWPAGIMAEILGKRFGCKTVLYEYLGPPDRIRSMPLATTAIRLATRVYCGSENNARDLSLMSGRTFDYFNLPTDGPDNLSPIVLCIGRLSPEKGMSIIPDIARALPRHEFLIVGSGVEYGRLRQAAPPNLFIARDHLGKSVLLKLMANASVVVNPSHYEGFGLVAAEASNMGARVIARNRGAQSEYAEIVVGEGATTKEWVDAILRISPEPESRGRSVGGGEFVSDVMSEYRMALAGPWPPPEEC